jgi:very-short-patch-repair endonuclease
VHSARVQLPTVIDAKRAEQQGMLTWGQLRSAGVTRAAMTRAVADGAVVRVRRNVYAQAALPGLPRFVVTDDGVALAYVAHVRAALLSLGDAASACGRTAAALYGWPLLVEPARTIDLAVSHGRSRVAARGVRAFQRRSVVRERRRVLAGTAAIWLTTPVQTVIDCATSRPLLEAVVVCDSALRARDVTIDELVPAAMRLRGVRDAARVRAVLAFCDARSESVLESVLRVQLLLAGIDGFVPQKVLRDLPGQHVRVDFCFQDAGLVVEVDGRRWHQEPAKDQARDNALAALGWRVLRYTWADVVHEPQRVVAEVRAAVAAGTASFHLAKDGARHAA